VERLPTHKNVVGRISFDDLDKLSLKVFGVREAGVSTFNAGRLVGTLMVQPSAVGDRYTLWITPHEGSTAKFDEAFGDQRHDLVPGQVAYGPRGVPHSYLVRSPQGARIAVLFSPAFIEEYFRANGTPVAEAGDLPPEFDLAAVVASAEAFHLRVTGPPPSL